MRPPQILRSRLDTRCLAAGLQDISIPIITPALLPDGGYTMAWLFFIDESGHDHKTMPYEVRGGFAIHVSQLWPFVQGMQRLETRCFGCRLAETGKEIKGSTLIGRKPFRFASQGEQFSCQQRQKLCRSFLTLALGRSPRRDEFTAYGQACLLMACEIVALLKELKAVLFATAIPRGVPKPPGFQADNYLRKDAVFLFERFFYFLKEKREHGVLVMDETDKHEDRRFVERMERYFTRTNAGKNRTSWIVPTPFFVSSDMAAAIQAADLCIYAINWGFRLPNRGMNAQRRNDITNMFESDLDTLQYRGQGIRDDREFNSYGIVFVPDPYEPRTST